MHIKMTLISRMLCAILSFSGIVFCETFTLKHVDSEKYLQVRGGAIMLDEVPSENAELQIYFAGKRDLIPRYFFQFINAPGKYISANSNGSLQLVNHAKGWETFQLLTVSNKGDYVIQTAHNTYLAVREQDNLIHTVPDKALAAQFRLTPKFFEIGSTSAPGYATFLDETEKNLTSISDNFLRDVKYLAATDDMNRIKYINLIAEVPKLSESYASTVVLIPQAGHPASYMIYHPLSGRYLNASDDRRTIGTSPHGRGWETFTLLSDGYGDIRLKTRHNTYIFANQNELQQTDDANAATSFMGLAGYEDENYLLRSDVDLMRKKLKASKKIISLGWNCGARHHIQFDYYRKGIATGFCDWVISENFDVILTILEHQDFAKGILGFKDNWMTTAKITRDRNKVTIDNQITIDFAEVHGGHAKLTLRTLPNFQSVHDIDAKKKDSNDKVLLEHIRDEFVQKYERRMERLISEIKGDEQLFFFRWHYNKPPMSPAQAQKFFERIDFLKPGNKHFLVNAGIEETSIRENQFPRFKYFNLKHYPLTKPNYSRWYRQDQFDWKHVFKWIDDH